MKPRDTTLHPPIGRAGEILWTLSSPDVARMLCDELGWSQAQHAQWLSDTLIRTVLPAD